MGSVTAEMKRAAEMTEMAYQASLAVAAPELSPASSETNAALEMILQMLIQYFPEFEKNRGPSGSQMYDLINRQMGMAVL